MFLLLSVKDDYRNIRDYVVKREVKLLGGCAVLCFTASERMFITAMCMLQSASLALCLTIVNKLFHELDHLHTVWL